MSALHYEPQPTPLNAALAPAHRAKKEGWLGWRSLLIDPQPGAYPLPSGGLGRARIEEVADRGVAELVRRYTSEFWDAAPKGLGVLMAGPARTWKSYGAAIIARHAFETCGVSTAWVAWPSVAPLLEVAPFREAEARLRYLQTIPFLVLDDFSWSRSEKQRGFLTAIASERYQSDLPTVWTGNVTIARDDHSAIDAATDACVGRRIWDMSTGYRLATRRSA